MSMLVLMRCRTSTGHPVAAVPLRVRAAMAVSVVSEGGEREH
jgi:hypothetical protein